MRWPLALLAFSTAMAQPVLLRESGFKAVWEIWARAPRSRRGDGWTRRGIARGPASLALSGNSNPAVCGGWQRSAGGIEPGRWYRLTAQLSFRGPAVRCAGGASAPGLERRAGKARRPAGLRLARRERWRMAQGDAGSPGARKGAAVNIQLLLLNAPHTTVWWDDITLEAIPAPAPRLVRVASLNLRPAKDHHRRAERRRFHRRHREGGSRKTDVIVLPEGITVVGTGKKYPRGGRIDPRADDRRRWAKWRVSGRRGSWPASTSARVTAAYKRLC